MGWIRMAAVAAGLSAAISAVPLAADAATVILQAAGSGSCTSSGCNNTNESVVSVSTTQNIGGTDTAYGWWAFAIPNLGPGVTITGATISIFNPGDAIFAESPGVDFYLPASISFAGLADQSLLLGSWNLPIFGQAPTGFVTFQPLSLTSIITAEGGILLFGGNPSGVHAANQFETFFDAIPAGGGAFLTLTTATPEPGTWALMIMGVGLVGAALRRRRRLACVEDAEASRV